MKPFHDLRIIEIAGSEAGAYCGRLFATLGATAIRVEPRGGSGRDAGEPWSGMGTTYVALNVSKQVVEIDRSTPAGAATLAELIAGADVLIESSAPEPLAPRADVPGAVVHVCVSPFGLSGPLAGHRSNPFSDEAIGGHLYLNGEPGREPIARPGLTAAYASGTHAFMGALAALRARNVTGRGQRVEVSHFEVLTSLHQHTTTMWTHAGFILRREGNRQPGLWHPVGVYQCKDGYVHLSLPSAGMVEPFLWVAELGHLLDDPRFATDLARGTHKDEFDAAIRPWLMEHTAEEIIALGQDAHCAIGPVPGMLDVVASEHLEARDYWAFLPGEPGLRLPRGPFRVSGHAFSAAAPRLTRVEEVATAEPAAPASARGEAPSEGPLAGVRVLDLTRVWAGPLAGRILGDLGADVIAVETPWGRGARTVSPQAPAITHLYPENELGEEPWNRVGGFNKLFRNRRGITLDLRNERCRELFAGLVRSSDVVLENYSPRVMDNMGFGYDALKALNPHIIYASMPGFGADGPLRNWVAYGPLIEAVSGMSSLMGYPDGGPYRSGVAWPDPVSGINAAAAILTALHDRDADPERSARRVEVPMIEAMTTFVGEELLAAQARGTERPRLGNRHPGRAPQGCYPAAGQDRWVAISVTTDAEWQSLCRLAGFPEELRRLSRDERKAAHDAIDADIARWTRTFPPQHLASLLQAAGIIAEPVSDGRDLVENAHLAERGFWAKLDHPAAGPRMYPGNPVRLSDTPVTYRCAAPKLGEHNDAILGGELGATPEELAELRALGVICETPPG